MKDKMNSVKDVYCLKCKILECTVSIGKCRCDIIVISAFDYKVLILYVITLGCGIESALMMIVKQVKTYSVCTVQ